MINILTSLLLLKFSMVILMLVNIHKFIW